MSKKAALILIHCGFVGWLIGYLAYDNKAEIGGRMYTQGMINSIIWMLFVPGYIVGAIFTIMAIVNICKGDEDYHLPGFVGNSNWFKNL